MTAVGLVVGVAEEEEEEGVGMVAEWVGTDEGVGVTGLVAKPRVLMPPVMGEMAKLWWDGSEL